MECVMPKTELEGLPVVDAGDDIKVAVNIDDLEAGNTKDPETRR